MHDNFKKGNVLFRKIDQTNYKVENVFPDHFDAINQVTNKLESFLICNLDDFVTGKIHRPIQVVLHYLDQLEAKIKSNSDVR